jgi:hypothetical protein
MLADVTFWRTQVAFSAPVSPYWRMPVSALTS